MSTMSIQEKAEGKYIRNRFLLPYEMDHVEAVSENLKSGFFPIEHKTYWLTRSGSRRLIKWSNTAQSESDGSVEYVIGTGIDITDTRTAEEKLQDSEERFALAIRGSGCGLWDWPDTGRDEVWWSPRLYEMLGFQDGEIESSLDAFSKLLHPEDRPKVQDAIDTHLNNGDMYDVEIRMKTKPGAYHWFRTTGAAIKNAEGRPVRMSGSLIDISDRKQVEEKLRYKQRQADKELEVAATIQQALIPRYSPRIGPIRLAWRFEPCDRIGGDIFNFQYTGKNHISFYMFDVCGHGVSSALIASAVSQFIQTSCSIMLPDAETPRPEAVLNNLEKAFPFERFDSFFTIVYITIDYAKGCLYYSSAGHPPLILMAQNGSPRILDVHGPVIGTGSVNSYAREKVQLRSGDKIILFTDGILDYSNANGDFFGKERLLRILGKFADSPVQILMDKVQESIKNFAGATPPNDDASIMAIEYVE